MSHSPADDHAAHSDDSSAHAAFADAHEEPLPDEPKTPLWLTALGGGLFFVLAVAWLASMASESGAVEAPSAASASAATLAPPPPAKAAPPMPPPAPSPIAAPPAPIPAPPPPIPPAGGAKNVKKPAK
ncbi:MAG TPA: hypothetical protein VK550_16235 [Polyangiaceae bacterium]|nr:hypothetical protein [Polyangiaceae bacterium]